MMQVRLIWDRGKREMSKCPLSDEFLARDFSTFPRAAPTGPLSSLASLCPGRGDTQKPRCLSPAGDDDGLLPVPGGVVSHDLGMGGDILW